MIYTREMRLKQMQEHLSRRVLVLDGAMGTAIQDRNLTAADFGGEALEGCNENLVRTRPDVILDIHKGYLAAGADIIETNTFGGTPLVLAEYGLAEHAEEINRVAAKLARQAANAFSSDQRPRFVAGSIGPTTKAISVTGGVTFDELVENFRVQARGLLLGESDYLLIETSQDTRNVKAALLGCDLAFADVGFRVPVAISGTIEPMGTMLAGQSAEALVASISHRDDLLYVGLNCATGPEFMTDHVRTLAGLARTRVACVPNAGLPDENGTYRETPEMLATVIARFGAAGWLNLIGGCCGTNTGHIAELRKVADAIRPREIPTTTRSMLSGIEYLEVTPELRPVLVGERTNVIGSRKFKDLIIAEKFEEAAEIARAQVKGGAQIIDVCLANPDRNEHADIEKFLGFVTKMVKVPLMIDSTDEKVIEASLKWCQGKAIINSINLEDGEERFEKVVPLAKKYGAALVVGTIDDDPKQGMGVTRQRKLEIARREYELLTKKYRVEPEDIWWDVLVFPCATGDAQYVGSAVETIEGLRLVKQEFPRTKSTLGVSNVSFGLPPAGREVLNSVFLYHCVQAGLDSAIVNTEKLERYASIPDNERELAEDLLFNRTQKGDVVARFAAHFREAKKTRIAAADLPLDERLARYIVEGTKEGLTADLQKKLDEGARPLDVINGPLMKGMDEVGRLFNDNKLIVAEVLQSAEAMKAAVSFLEPFMEKNASASRGKVLLATVKGDVHDIGKNLVEIILGNNGFQVVNLGIKVPPEQLLAAIREHKPDLVGLSGLLVKSAQQMVITAADLTVAGVKLPMLVGGAALSRNFVDKKIAPAYDGGFVSYANDAMDGLELAKKIVDKDGFAKLKKQTEERRRATAGEEAPVVQEAAPTTRSKEIEPLPIVPDAPYWERRIDTSCPVDIVWRYVNPRMLYGRHLGLRGNVLRLLEEGETQQLRQTEPGRKALELQEAVASLKEEIRRRRLLKPKAVWQFLPAESDGNELRVLSADRKTVRAAFTFPRQARENGLCLADLVNPKGSGAPDHIGALVVTAGEGVREVAEKWKTEGRYLKSHLLQALALESAEGYAEYLHSQFRGLWGFPDEPDTSMLSLFQARYRGKRYSFGYPACPRLDDQKPLFDLLKPEEIGVQLTDGFMMDPEASVSALVFHHPEASYFSVGQLAIDQAADELGDVALRQVRRTGS